MTNAEQKHAWTLGGLGGEPGAWVVTSTRTLSESQFDELSTKCEFVTQLVAQRNFNRLAAVLNRWNETLALVEQRLESQGDLAGALRIAAARDLSAVTTAVRFFDEDLYAKSVDANAGLDPDLLRSFEGIWRGVRAKPSHLMLQELGRRAADGLIELVASDSGISFEGVNSFTASEVAVEVFGWRFPVLFSFIDLFAAEFDRHASELERLAADVRDGAPSLISYVLVDGDPTGLTTIGLPMAEIEAFRQARQLAATCTTPLDWVRTLGPLLISGPQTRVLIGGVDVAHAVVGGTSTSAVNEIPHAKINLDLSLLGSAPVDYWGTVRWEITQGPFHRELFSGAATHVSGSPQVELECEGAIELLEHSRGGVAAANVSPGELIRSMMEQAGVDEDALFIAEPRGDRPVELFEVFVPIVGLEVDEPIELGLVEIVPAAQCQEMLAGFDLSDPLAASLKDEFGDARSYGSASVKASTLPEAEAAGWAMIETVVSWLVIRSHDGSARLPDGSAQSFTRQNALRGPHTGSTVLVCGSQTGRQWLRRRSGAGTSAPQRLSPQARMISPALPGDLSPRERASLLALRRAINETVTELQVQALWEALESYARGVKVPGLFSDEEKSAVVAELPAWLGSKQREKLERLVSSANEAPLLERLRRRIDQDAVTLNGDEDELLFGKLRKARNDLAHGREIDNPPTRGEMHRANSVAARIVLRGIAARRDLTSDQVAKLKIFTASEPRRVTIRVWLARGRQGSSAFRGGRRATDRLRNECSSASPPQCTR